jgi:hypothetical protein
MGPTPKCHFVSGLPSWSLEILENFKIGILATLEAHNFFCKPPMEMRSKVNYSPHQELSNGLWHATCTQGNRCNSRLLMVRNQTTNLTPDFFFGHNLCFKNPNGLHKPILDIYVPKLSNDIKNFLIEWVLTPTISLWKFESPLGFQLLKWELIWECGGSFLHNLLHSWEHEMWLPITLGLHLCKPLLWSWAQG